MRKKVLSPMDLSFLILSSLQKDFTYGPEGWQFIAMVQFQVNAPNGVPNEVLKRSCRNTDLAKTLEQLWFSTLMYFASVLRV